MLRQFKNYLRRRRLTRRGVVPQATFDTWAAGDRSGVWTVRPDLLDRASIVYSFGVGDNLTWELALIERFGLTVHAFDPTPASVAWVERQSLPPQLKFHPIGIAGRDGTMSFSLPKRGSRFNYRPQSGHEAAETELVKAPVMRLSTLQTMLGEARLDILKMDVEGAEYEALDDLLAAGIRPRQLLIEFHHHFPGIGLEATLRRVRTLEAAGYKLFHLSERGLEFSFGRND